MSKIVLGSLVLALTFSVYSTELVKDPSDCPSNTEAQPVYIWSKVSKKFIFKGYTCNEIDLGNDKPDRD